MCECVLSSTTKTLHAVANIVYFAALCQRWMLQAIVIRCSSPSPIVSMFLCMYTIFIHVRKNFPHKLFKSLFMFGLITIFYIRNHFSHSLAATTAATVQLLNNGIIKRPGKSERTRMGKNERESKCERNRKEENTVNTSRIECYMPLRTTSTLFSTG